jgi:hypothetical protein
MSIECPQCLSPGARERHRGKQFGAAIGALVGALAGAIPSSLGLGPAKIKGLPIPLAGPPGMVAGAITGGLAGSAAGAALGDAIDKQFFDTHLCPACGNTFRIPNAELPMWDNK